MTVLSELPDRHSARANLERFLTDVVPSPDTFRAHAAALNMPGSIGSMVLAHGMADDHRRDRLNLHGRAGRWNVAGHYEPGGSVILANRLRVLGIRTQTGSRIIFPRQAEPDDGIAFVSTVRRPQELYMTSEPDAAHIEGFVRALGMLTEHLLEATDGINLRERAA